MGKIPACAKNYFPIVRFSLIDSFNQTKLVCISFKTVCPTRCSASFESVTMKLKIFLRAFRQIVLVSTLFACCFAVACSASSKGKGEGDGDGKFSDSDLSLDGNRFGDGSIPLGKETTDGPFADIRFDYDSSAIREEYKAQIRQDAKVLNEDPTIRVEVEGHCDKRGTAEYNMALGEERAKAVASMLLSLGVSKSRVHTISYGAEIPVDPTNNEQAYAKNRRVHFALSREQGAGGEQTGSRDRSGRRY